MEFKRLDRLEVTKGQFSQIMEVENSTGSGYSEEVMRIIQKSDLKPLIHKPDNPFTARFATKKDVLNYLKRRL